MSTHAIADHALLSDCHSAALVTRDGSVDWLCFPRFDSPSVFGRLLDDQAGHFAVHPAEAYTATRRYLDASMVLETTFRTASGTVVVTDAMALGDSKTLSPTGNHHQLGTGAPHLLIRRVECTDGEVDVEVEFAPRPEYGLITPLLSEVDGGIAGRGGAEWLVLTAPVRLHRSAGTAGGSVHLAAGQVRLFALQRTTLGDEPARVWDAGELQQQLDVTTDAWRRWSREHQGYEGPWQDLVHASGRVLQALHYQPSRAVVAAATTSLPEGVGGERNWDYRYAWVRDASFTLNALWVAACPDEAGEFFAFMCTAAASSLDATRTDGRSPALQIMFGIGGERDLSERTLDHLDGWRASRPVRVGNGAWNQQQVDVYGELLDAAHRLADQLGDLDEETRAFLVGCADTAAVKWREKDQGIWEQRGEPRDFLYSKVMCWVALDRAVRLADRLDADDRRGEWEAARDEIHRDVLEKGWSERARAFAQYYGGSELDASNLMMPIVGFLPATDPRMRSTIDAIAERLTDDRGLVYRYRTAEGDNADGLSGEEGTFLLCTFWLAQAQAMAGELAAATATFERAIGYANDLGLLAEEVDGATGELLGNFPQAFSHIGLVNAAYAISQAQQHAGAPDQRSPMTVTASSVS